MTTRQVVISELQAFTERLVKRLALNVNAELIEATPVLTGWAQANWVPNIGSPFEGTAGERPADQNTNPDRGPQSRGIASIITYRLGPEIHQTNNVPYIELLNAGSSSQAPAAFVQASILRAVRRTQTRTV